MVDVLMPPDVNGITSTDRSHDDVIRCSIPFASSMTTAVNQPESLFLLDHRLSSVLLKFPISVIQGTYLAGFEPTGNTVEVKSVVADTPSDSALFAGG